VIRMVGMVSPEATRWRCSSSPDIPGICTSAIRQEVRRTWREFKNSSAEAKAWAVYPKGHARSHGATVTSGVTTTLAQASNRPSVMTSRVPPHLDHDTISNHLAALRTLFRYAKRNRKIPSDAPAFWLPRRLDRSHTIDMS
jgi:hypothetical protein